MVTYKNYHKLIDAEIGVRIDGKFWRVPDGVFVLSNVDEQKTAIADLIEKELIAEYRYLGIVDYKQVKWTADPMETILQDQDKLAALPIDSIIFCKGISINPEVIIQIWHYQGEWLKLFELNNGLGGT